VDRHPFLAFVLLAYAISWSLWLVAALGGGRIPFLIGALGPMAAAALVTPWSGRSLAGWIRPVRRWRVPVLLERYSPVRATVLLGLVWGVWHIPVYGPAGFVVPLVLAFFYTLLWNATHSVGLCILLHASFTPAQDHFILLPRERAYTRSLDAPDWVILGTYLAAALVVVALTRGRLGQRGVVPSISATVSG
jgi:Type II CAAX prenyl endopeptidase Rce1-like